MKKTFKVIEELLDACGVGTPVYVVSHSYGGFITMLASAKDGHRIAGLVLVDANMPAYFTQNGDTTRRNSAFFSSISAASKLASPCQSRPFATK